MSDFAKDVSQDVPKTAAGLSVPFGGACGPALPSIHPFVTEKRLKAAVLALLLLLPTLFLGAQQSFFVAPGTEIKNGQVVRGYCLEYTRPSLTNDNVGNLTRMIGSVTVTYKDGTEVIQSFADLCRDKPPSFTGFNSYEFLKMDFDPSIEKITVDDAGIIMARADADDDFIMKNVRTVMEARRAGMSHAAAQYLSWEKEWKPIAFFDEKLNATVLDNRPRTGTAAGEEAVTRTGSDASVLITYPGGKQSAFDTVAPAINGRGSVFITHGHGDHMSAAELDRVLKEGLQGALYVPMFLRGESMKNSAFNTLTAIADSGEYGFDIQNLLCQLQARGVKDMTHILNSTIGDFLYSQYVFDTEAKDKALIEIFRYLNPVDANTDGSIFRLTYKGIRLLIPGDFDNERALKGLIEASNKNMERRLEIREEIARLEEKKYSVLGYQELADKIERRDALVQGLYILEGINRVFPGSGSLIRRLSYVYELNSLGEELSGDPAFNEWLETDKTIAALENEYERLPVLRSHYMKWPHHAHIFKDAGLYDEIKSAVDPFYILLQPHQTQKNNLDLLKETLKAHALEYIDSSEHPVEMYSLKHHQPPLYRVG
ncbi:MAG: hypothetical protein LBO04_00635 [Spirochaetaceae bacterium]|jgi:hypothetical protein|nr:hypothetical protein [Spirochaetaceae bacterium]